MQRKILYPEKPLVLGLLGYPISHSFSPAWFRNKFLNEGISNGEYRLFGLPDLSDIRPFMGSIRHLVGFNVTIPHKKAIIPYLDFCAEEVLAIGAVNTVLIRNGQWEGYNTDVIGFEDSLSDHWSRFKGGAGLILGSGGAAAAAAFVMRKYGMEVQFLDRTAIQGLPDSLPRNIREYAIIVNATPIGMHPETNQAPRLPYDKLHSEQFVYDMVYNPEKTLFLRFAEERGIHVLNGHNMLTLQAEAAWNIWKRYWIES